MNRAVIRASRGDRTMRVRAARGMIALLLAGLSFPATAAPLTVVETGNISYSIYFDCFVTGTASSPLARFRPILAEAELPRQRIGSKIRVANRKEMTDETAAHCRSR